MVWNIVFSFSSALMWPDNAAYKETEVITSMEAKMMRWHIRLGKINFQSLTVLAI